MDRNDIKQLLHNYSWMVETIILKRNENNNIGQKVTTSYGIEAALPKGKGSTSDPIYFEVIRREQKTASIKELEAKVMLVQKAMDLISDVRERTILNMILDGRSLRSISRSTRIPLSNVARLRDNIVDTLYTYYEEQMKQRAH